MTDKVSNPHYCVMGTEGSGWERIKNKLSDPTKLGSVVPDRILLVVNVKEGILQSTSDLIEDLPLELPIDLFLTPTGIDQRLVEEVRKESLLLITHHRPDQSDTRVFLEGEL